jgi:hypothetical protein
MMKMKPGINTDRKQLLLYINRRIDDIIINIDVEVDKLDVVEQQFYKNRIIGAVHELKRLLAIIRENSLEPAIRAIPYTCPHGHSRGYNDVINMDVGFYCDECQRFYKYPYHEHNYLK